MTRRKSIYIKYFFSLILFLSLIFIFTNNPLNAEMISFDEAVNIGLENNSEIKKMQNNIDKLKRNEKTIKAKKGWNLEMNGNYNYDFDEDEDESDLINNNVKNDNSQDSVSLSANKVFNFGLNLNPSLNINEDEEILSINITQRLYPLEESELEKQLYNNKKELIKAQDELENLKAEKIISWVEKYLNIIRMEEKKNIYKESLEKAKNNFTKVKKEKEIGEAGKQQLLTAELSLETAKYNLKEQRYNLTESKEAFKAELGLNNKNEISYTLDSRVIINLKKVVDSLTNDYLNNDDLMEVVEKNNSNLIINKIDMEIIKKEIEWLKDENKINVDLSSDYDTSSEDLSATLNFSYNLYDGGKYNLNLEEKKENIENKKDDYEEKYRNLELELQRHLNKLSLNKDNFKKQKLSYDRTAHELKVFKTQLESGVIDYLEYQEKWIESKEAEINLESLKDSIFIDKLKFIKFVNSEKVNGGF